MKGHNLFWFLSHKAPRTDYLNTTRGWKTLLLQGNPQQFFIFFYFPLMAPVV